MSIFNSLQQLINAQPPVEAVHPAQISELPTPLRRIMVRAVRRGEVSAIELAQEFDESAETLHYALEDLVKQGYLRPCGDGYYEAVFGRRRARQLPTGIWSRLNQEIA